MSTHRQIDRICAVVMAFAVVLTILFMNGQKLGLTLAVDSDSEAHSDDSHFTDNDLKADWDRSGASVITLEGDSATVSGTGCYVYENNVVIAKSGTYVVSGSLTGGSIVVDADDTSKVWILFDGVEIEREDDACLIIDQADKVFLTLAEGSENILTSGDTYSEEALEDNTDGAIFAHDDLTINGSGSLSVTAGYKHGIAANDDMVITGGNITVSAVKDGIHANDSLRITEATLDVTAGDDGLTSDNEGSYVYIKSGNISIECEDEGIVSAGDVTIDGGNMSISVGTEQGHHGIKAAGTCTVTDGTILIDSCYEGIQANYIDIQGGDITIYPADDGMNASSGSSTEDMFGMAGGDFGGQMTEMGQMPGMTEMGQMPGMSEMGQMPGEADAEAMTEAEGSTQQAFGQPDEQGNMQQASGDEDQASEEVMTEAEDSVQQAFGQPDQQSNMQQASGDEDQASEEVMTEAEDSVQQAFGQPDQQSNMQQASGDEDQASEEVMTEAEGSTQQAQNQKGQMMPQGPQDQQGQMPAMQGMPAMTETEGDGSSETSRETETETEEELPWLHISGGSILIVNETGMDADGLDSNGDILISGGDVRVSLTGSGSNSAIDYASESGGTCEITGGTVIACGSYSMAEGFSSDSTQASILYSISDGTEDDVLVALQDEEGNELLSWTVPYSFTAVTFSCPELTVGETYRVVIGDSSEDVPLTEIAISTGDAQSTMFGGTFNMGGGMQPMGGGMQAAPDGGMDPPQDGQGGFAPGTETEADGSVSTENNGQMMQPQGNMAPPQNGQGGFAAGTETEADGSVSTENSGQMMQPQGNMAPSQSGMAPPQNGQGGYADGTETEEDGSVSTENSGQMMQPQGGMTPDQNQPGSGMGPESDTSESEDDSTDSDQTREVEITAETKIIWGLSFVVLAIGLLIAWRYRRH